MTDVIEAEVVTEETAVVPASNGPVSLFRTDDPAEVLKRAKATADALAPVIRAAGMVVTVSGKDYLNVEAWQILGQQVGVTPVIVATKKLSDPDGWEARCEARTLDGRTIGAADSMCLRTEARWKDSEEFELRSMAQTRSMSRALASVLRFIPTLAGMGGTPAEEMGNVKRSGGGDGRKPSEKQLAFLERLIGEKYEGDDGNAVRSLVPNLDGGQVSKAISGLKDSDEQVRTELLANAKDWLSKQSDLPDDAPPEVEMDPADEEIPF